MFGDRIDPATITLNGVVLDPATSYRIVTNNFLADGVMASRSSVTARTAALRLSRTTSPRCSTTWLPIRVSPRRPTASPASEPLYRPGRPALEV